MSGDIWASGLYDHTGSNHIAAFMLLVSILVFETEYSIGRSVFWSEDFFKVLSKLKVSEVFFPQFLKRSHISTKKSTFRKLSWKFSHYDFFCHFRPTFRFSQPNHLFGVEFDKIQTNEHLSKKIANFWEKRKLSHFQFTKTSRTLLFLSTTFTLLPYES